VIRLDPANPMALGRLAERLRQCLGHDFDVAIH